MGYEGQEEAESKNVPGDCEDGDYRRKQRAAALGARGARTSVSYVLRSP